MSWAGRAALAVATLAATAAGWFVTGALVDDGGDGGSATATADVELISCPTAGGAVTIGSLAAGDRVWLVGVTGDRWAVIRHPEEPQQPAWVPLADLATAATADDLPVLTCADAETVMVTTTTSSTVVTLPGTPGYGAVFLREGDRLVHVVDLDPSALRNQYRLLPGTYQVVYRSRSANRTEYSTTKDAVIESGRSVTINF